jgi:hypothetical protein
MSFSAHPSERLTKLYGDKPFQGQSPEMAQIIFISSDANYSAKISEHPFFERILEYHSDGVKFWEQYGVHHPFLLDAYPFNRTRDGVPFHSRFRKLKLDSGYAKHISFLELLDKPTIGNKSSNRASFIKLVSEQHLEYLDKLIMSDSNKLFFVSAGVLKDMRELGGEFGLFQWIKKEVSGEKLSIDIGENRVKEIYHFSSSHIFRQIDGIRKDIDDWMDQSNQLID